jgi:hypothetical protein
MSAETDDPGTVRYLGGRKFLACQAYLAYSFVLALTGDLTTLWAACGTTALAVYTGVNTYLHTRSQP